MTVAPSLATARWEQGRQRAAQLRHFYVHVLAFVVGNTTAFVVNWMTMGNGNHSWWFQWGLVVWTTALAVHGLTVVGRSRWLGPEWERRQIERYLRATGGADDGADGDGADAVTRRAASR